MGCLKLNIENSTSLRLFNGGNWVVSKKDENLYRYGYQGSEKDDEIKGEGNSYTTFYRQLDPRIGRWLSLDPKMAKYPHESPYVSMGNNPIMMNDPLGDTITQTKAFKGDAGYIKAYDNFANSKAGKKFEKDYGIGGKYEHVSVIFDTGEGSAGTGGWTSATAVSKTNSKDIISLDGVSEIANGDLLAQGKIETHYLRFTITMNKYHSDDKLTNVSDGASILHETQHIEIGIMGLLNSKNKMSRIPASPEQHQLMRNEKQHYYWDRVNYWWQYTPVWYNDFKQDQKTSLEHAKDPNPLNYHKKIFKAIDYINEEDQFLDR